VERGIGRGNATKKGKKKLEGRGRRKGLRRRFSMSIVWIMTTTQASRASKVHRVFLHDILRHCGGGLVLLCSASFSGQFVTEFQLRWLVKPVRFVQLEG
jgi:hypothetical protein